MSVEWLAGVAAPAGERGFTVAGRADALHIVNDALGSFLLRASEAIDKVPMYSHQHDIERADRDHGDVENPGQADHGVPNHANRVV